jgi:hypothetical protein
MHKVHLNRFAVDNQELDALVMLNCRIAEGDVRRIYTTNRDYRANLEPFMIACFNREMGKITITQVAAHRGECRRPFSRACRAVRRHTKVEQSEQERRQAEIKQSA